MLRKNGTSSTSSTLRAAMSYLTYSTAFMVGWNVHV